MCKVASVLKKTTKAMPNLDKVILRARKQGSLKQLIRSTALVISVFLADYRITTDSVDTCTNPGDKINKMNKIDEVTASEYHDAWLFLIMYDKEQRFDEKNGTRLVPSTVEEKLTNYNYVVKYIVMVALFSQRVSL